MKRLRHPVRAIREPFGTAGLIVAMIALVAALGGTALAAAKLNSTQKKEVEKIAKKFAGKPGANGANGTNGSPGAKGDAGAAGANGTNGTNGGPGESVTNKSLPVGNATCKEGGAEFIVGATKTHACNGSPWTAGGTLPSKATETGTWAFGPLPAGTNQIAVASFPVPLSAELGASHVHLINSSGKELHFEAPATTPTECGETVGTVLEPTASPGNLCVYIDTLSEAEGFSEGIQNPQGAPGAGKTGALMLLIGLPAEHPESGHGTWAVTAP